MPVPEEVDMRDARRGQDLDLPDAGHSLSGTGNRTSDTSAATGISLAMRRQIIQDSVMLSSALTLFSVALI